MKVILTRDIRGIGKKGDIKDLKDGYVLNFLIPKHLAIPANSGAIAARASEQRAHDERRATVRASLDAQLVGLADAPPRFQLRADSRGHVFGSVTAAQITEALTMHGIAAELIHAVLLPHPLKTLGTHTIPIRFAEGKEATIAVVLEALSE